jgi:hypothetical protein
MQQHLKWLPANAKLSEAAAERYQQLSHLMLKCPTNRPPAWHWHQHVTMWSLLHRRMHTITCRVWLHSQRKNQQPSPIMHPRQKRHSLLSKVCASFGRLQQSPPMRGSRQLPFDALIRKASRISVMDCSTNAAAAAAQNGS